MALLCTVPDLWSCLITSMWFSNSEDFNYDNVIGALLCEELRRTNSSEKETIIAMATRGRSREHGKNSRNDSRSKSRVKKGSQSDDIVAN